MNTHDCRAMHSHIAASGPGMDDGPGPVSWGETPEAGCARGLCYGLLFVLPFWVTVIAVWLR